MSSPSDGSDDAAEAIRTPPGPKRRPCRRLRVRPGLFGPGLFELGSVVRRTEPHVRYLCWIAYAVRVFLSSLV